MKINALLILISLMALNAFCLTQEEKDKIFDAIVAKAKAPDLSSPGDVLSFIGASDDVITNNLLSEAISKDKEGAYKAAKYLNSLPPSILIPALYELRLDGKINTIVNYYASMWKSETNKYDKSSYLYILNNMPIVQKEKNLYGVVDDYSIHCGETYLEGDLIEMVDPNALYVGSLKAYWWLEGRRFMPEIWNDWYPCWKNEMAREEPRELIVKKLISDISCFGTFLFPYLNEAIKEGDDSLATVLDEVRYHTRLDLPSVNEFCEWYSTNHFKYDYPPCEGIRKTIERVTDPYVLSELKGEDTYADEKKYGDKWVFGKMSRQMFKQILWKVEDYYNNRDFPPNYWYYKVPNEAVVKHGTDITDFIHSKKFNQRFIEKLEKERK